MNEYGYNDWRNYLMHYNHNHDALGRFTTSGYAALVTKADGYKSKYQRQKIKADKAAAKAAKTYRKLSKYDKRYMSNPGARNTLFVKKGHKLENKYAKQKVKADKLSSKAAKTYKKEVRYEEKAAKYLKGLEKQNRDLKGYTFSEGMNMYYNNSNKYRNINIQIHTDNPRVANQVYKDLPVIDSKIRSSEFNSEIKEIESYYGKSGGMDLDYMEVDSKNMSALIGYTGKKWDGHGVDVNYDLKNKKIGRIVFNG